MRQVIPMVALGAALLLVIVSGANAQTLDSEVQRLLEFDCADLGLVGGNSNFPGALGPNLDTVCQINTGIAFSSTGGGAASPQASDASIESQRALERLEQERNGDEGDGAKVATRLFEIDGLGLWLTGDFAREGRDVTTFEDGYKSDVWTGVAGVDYRFADFLFAGVAFNYRNIDGDFKGGGGFETDSYGGVVYGSFTPFSEIFLDAAVGYAAKSYDVQRSVSFTELESGVPPPGSPKLAGIASSDTNGREFTTRVVAGYEYAIGSVSITPRAGVNFSHNKIDGFRETGRSTIPMRSASGLELVFNDRTRQSLQSEVGLGASVAASTTFGVVIPEVDVEWIHEFQDDQRHASVRFAEDLRSNPTTFSFQNEAPDRDFFVSAR